MAIAFSLPMGRVSDWAAIVGAQPVSVEGSGVEPAGPGELGVDLAHRCQVAMPWEWRQANAFTEQERRQVASRHMLMSATNGNLAAGGCEQVMRLFEGRQPIGDELWERVSSERTRGLIDYQMASNMRHQGGGQDPAAAFRKVRAAEVIQCLQNHHTDEGCADLLYAARLAGAPLSQEAAVA